MKATHKIIPFPGRTFDDDVKALLRETYDALISAKATGDSDSYEWAAHQIARLGTDFAERWPRERAAFEATTGVKVG